jgi:hypothetical protein
MALVPVLALAGPADIGYRGWGPRLGFSSGPDQFIFGAQLDFGNFGQHVRFQPNIEMGLGDHRTTGAINLDTTYRFSSNWDVWSPYLGGGLGLSMSGSDNGLAHDSDTGIGASAIGGIEKGLSNGDRFFTEVKLGAGDAPDLKLMIGWTFYH